MVTYAKVLVCVMENRNLTIFLTYINFLRLIELRQ